MLENLPTTLLGVTKYLSDPQVCIDIVKFMRWGESEPVCQHCGETGAYFLASRKIFKCKKCRKQFSVKMGTIFEESAVGLNKWLIAIWQLVNCKNGISSYELGKGIGVTQRTAWFMLQRIRTAMSNGTIEKMTGTIEIDEAYIGGLPKNMHQSKKARFVSRYTRQFPRNKTAVVGMVERGGQVRAKVVHKGNTLKREDVMPIIKQNIEPESHVMTDEAVMYRDLWEKYVHATINHSREYVRGNVHTNSIENFWSLLKRSIKGTYVSVSPVHLQKYVEEQVFRYNTRQGNDRERFIAVLNQVSGKRMTYAELTDHKI